MGTLHSAATGSQNCVAMDPTILVDCYVPVQGDIHASLKLFKEGDLSSSMVNLRFCWIALCYTNGVHNTNIVIVYVEEHYFEFFPQFV